MEQDGATVRRCDGATVGRWDGATVGTLGPSTPFGARQYRKLNKIMETAFYVFGVFFFLAATFILRSIDNASREN